LWGQQLKLIQATSNSELRENQWNDLLFFESVPSHCFGASEASKIDCFKRIKAEVSEEILKWHSHSLSLTAEL
jgi:hypothetical protein